MLNLLSRILYVTFLILVIIGISKLYLPFNVNDYERILKNDEIIIGIRTGPASYYEIKNQKIGFTYELVKELSQHLNVNLKIKTIDSIEEAINDLNERKIDILVDVGLIERKGQIYSHRKTDYHLVYNNKYYNKLSDLDKISEDPINIIDSPKIETIVNKYFKPTKANYNILDSANIDEIVHLLLENKIRYTVLSSDELFFYQDDFPEISSVFKIATDIKSYWTLPDDSSNHLQEKISEFFTFIIKENKLKYIKQRNLNNGPQYNFVGSKNFVNDLANIFPQYEFYFKSFSKKYGHDWRLLASIGYQESHWNKDAISYTGVKGIMMLTKNTAKDMKVNDRTNPRDSIYGGAKYLKKMLDKVPNSINDKDKIWFAIAAYNIGYGHIIDAIDLAKKDNKVVSDWKSIEPYLLKLSQSRYYKKTKFGYARGWETVKYVQNIRQYYDILVFLDSQDNIINNNKSDNKIPSTL
jgi:membrane-bound lytic murein transglycosylase F